VKNEEHGKNRLGKGTNSGEENPISGE